uniref:trimethyltridecatetraene synthase-like n=1 Tax=Erigeron canadensis TaxID=72917 RepID=UPI001CB8C511|nr:trimethyltridecatetraene synthase-like [Erigeron canadensis]
MESGCFWILLAIAITLLMIMNKLLNYPYDKKNLPPGPKPWPLIGNLNLIGPLPHRSLHTLSQTYGKLMHLKFGSTPVVVASSPDMARQFLRTHDSIFASRPLTAAGKYTTYNYHNITWAPYGPYWSQGRKIYLNELFSSKRLGSSEHIRIQEMQTFLSRLHTMSGETITLKDHVSRINLSVISRIVLGRKYFSKSEDEKETVTLEEFQEMLDELFLLNGVLNIGDWMPWTGFMDLQGYVKRMKALCKRFDRFHDHVLEEHRARMKVEGREFVAKDMVDVLLKLADDPNLEVKLDSDGVKGFIQDLIAGGTDTAATTVEWAMSELIKQPHLMMRATEELNRVIGRERWVQETDFPNLPFIDSILKETMRMHPVAVLLAPHLALEDCKVAGYDIAKGTTVFINSWSIGRDPDVWDDPESFQPERFLGRDDIDVKGQNFELLPFGSGRRMCPGYSLGLKMMKSLLGNLLHGFYWKLPNNMMIDEDINYMEEVYGLSTQRKFPLVCVLEPRLPPHMYK